MFKRFLFCKFHANLLNPPIKVSSYEFIDAFLCQCVLVLEFVQSLVLCHIQAIRRDHICAEQTWKHHKIRPFGVITSVQSRRVNITKSYPDHLIISIDMTHEEIYSTEHCTILLLPLLPQFTSKMQQEIYYR